MISLVSYRTYRPPKTSLFRIYIFAFANDYLSFMLQLKEQDLNKLILIGDHILIKPTKPLKRTESGLFLPQGMHKKEDLRTGYVIKVRTKISHTNGSRR